MSLIRGQEKEENPQGEAGNTDRKQDLQMEATRNSWM